MTDDERMAVVSGRSIRELGTGASLISDTELRGAYLPVGRARGAWPTGAASMLISPSLCVSAMLVLWT